MFSFKKVLEKNEKLNIIKIIKRLVYFNII